MVMHRRDTAPNRRESYRPFVDAIKSMVAENNPALFNKNGFPLSHEVARRAGYTSVVHPSMISCALAVIAAEERGE
jgi:hypothetical protein